MRTETTKDTKHTKPKGTRNRFLRTSCVSWFGNFLALVIVGFSCAAQAATGTSAEFEVDLRDGIRQSAGDETLTYSSLWDGDANATVTIAQDGVAIAEGLTGEGDRAW